MLVTTLKNHRLVRSVQALVMGSKVGTGNESERVNWLSETLKTIPEGARILDAGAGEQQFKRLCSHLNYISQDFAQYDGKGNSKGMQVEAWDQTQLDIISDITSIPEPDSSFDAIMCIEVFEHLPDPISALREFSRLLKNNGYLILTAPFCSLTHFAPYHFYSGFNRYFYDRHLPENSFEIAEIKANGNYFEYIAQEIGRVPFSVNRYTNEQLTRLDALILKLAVKVLGRYSLADTGSAEILCYGYQVLARKVPPETITQK